MKAPPDHPRQNSYRTPETVHPWTVSMIGTMLIVEAVLLFLVGLFQMLTGSARVFLSPTLLWILDHLAIHYHPVLGSSFILLSVWALAVTVLFLRISPSAWLPALGLQGTILAVSIARFYIDKPIYGYIFMVYAIWLVIYLHYSEIEITFHVQSSQSEKTRL